ncbi:MAG: hypothetical protein ACI81L_003455 [Verrucomicrobiales bacterium]|jgi:hypothetical protein
MHPSALARALDEANAAIIEDPMSFPWDAFDGDLDCPLIIDLAPCTEADRVALVPALFGLTLVDVVIDSTYPGSPDASHVASLVGATTELPAPVDGPLLRTRKRMELTEREIVARVRREHGDDAHIASISGRAVRSHRGGIHALTAGLSPADGNWAIVGLWGIRPQPGSPLDRAVIAYSQTAAH